MYVLQKSKWFIQTLIYASLAFEYRERFSFKTKSALFSDLSILSCISKKFSRASTFSNNF